MKNLKSSMKRQSRKPRVTWTIRPTERVKPSGRIYDRKKSNLRKGMS